MLKKLQICLNTMFLKNFEYCVLLTAYIVNLQNPKDVQCTFFNRIVILAVFEPVPVVSGP